MREDLRGWFTRHTHWRKSSVPVVPGQVGGGSFRGKEPIDLEILCLWNVRRATNQCDAQASHVPSGSGALALASFVSVLVMSCAVIWCGMMSCGWLRGEMKWCDWLWGDVKRVWLVARCHVRPCDFTWCGVIWRHVLWCHVTRDVMCCHVMWCDVTGGTVMQCDLMWCHVIWCGRDRTHRKTHHFGLCLSPKFSPNAAPATKSDTPTLPNTAPARKVTRAFPKKFTAQDLSYSCSELLLPADRQLLYCQLSTVSYSTLNYSTDSYSTVSSTVNCSTLRDFFIRVNKKFGYRRFSK